MKVLDRVGLASLLAWGTQLAACGQSQPSVAATVLTIDRMCTIITETRSKVSDPRSPSTTLNASKFDSSRGECKSVGEWDDIRKKRTKAVEGDAVVHLSYVAPNDGQTHLGSVRFDGRDDEFYDLDAGDTVKIYVSPDDPDKITAA
jgi:hypothetical protein